MAVNIQIYLTQAIQFLKSCTIVFSPLAVQENNNIINAGGTVDLADPASFKYYLNLSGQYHSTDTVMMIQSLDTQQTVEFTTTMLASSPKTQAAYTIGSSYYNALCQTYPTQVDLIKSILYPVDLETAVNSPDFTLLGWGDGYLEEYEQAAIINEINAFLAYASSSWYFNFLNYECYYIWTFWASLWQTLPNVIYAARLKYLKTSYVHSFHIWNYLESNGISDYSDILSRQQSLFLYRNINYLLENRGTQSNLVILVDNILNTLSVGLVGKTIYMNTETNAATCQWTPEFVSSIIPTDNSQSLTIIPPESMTQINSDLVTAGFDVNTDADYVLEQQTQIGNTPLNILKTKLVEIQKLGVDQKYGGVLNNFLLDTLVSMIVTGRYVPQLNINDPTTNIPISLQGKDVLALYYYVIHRSVMDQPIDLPVVYVPSCAFQYNVSSAEFPESFSYGGYTYPTRSYLSISDMIAGITYPSTTIVDPDDFTTLVSDLFLILIQNIRYSRTEGNYISLQMFLSYMNKYVLQTTPYTFTLSTYTDYTSWAANVGLTTLFSELDANSDYQDAYSSLATAITSAIIPADNSTVFSFFGYTPESSNNTYDRIKDLFIQLCSYNIAFLDTSRVDTWWFFTERIIPWVNGINQNTIIEANLVTGLPEIIPSSQDFVTIPSSEYIARITPESNVIQQLLKDDMVSIGTETTTTTILNPRGLTQGLLNQVDSQLVVSRHMTHPVFVSSTF